MIVDPIADMLIRIKNAYMAHRDVVEIPKSRLKHELALLLAKLNYVDKVNSDSTYIKISLFYRQGKPATSGVKRLSKPGLRRYAGVDEIKKMHFGLGHLVISTPQGLKTHKEAIKAKMGGEILFQIW